MYIFVIIQKVFMAYQMNSWWSSKSEPKQYFQPYFLLSSLTHTHLILQWGQLPDLCSYHSIWNLSYSSCYYLAKAYSSLKG